MSDESQLVIPASFVALYITPGRFKPNASRNEIAARYEFCEDLASLLVDTAQARLWELGVTQDDILQRVHGGLLEGQSGASASEAGWIIRRLAELLGWALPDVPDPETAVRR